MIDQFFRLIKPITKFRGKPDLIEIDFAKSFWFIYLQRKWKIGVVVIFFIIKTIFLTLLPYFSIRLITNFKQTELIILIVAFVLVSIGQYIEFFLSAIIHNEIFFSLKTRALEFFLKTDPLSHSTRSSGQIISKVERGAHASSQIFEIIIFEVIVIFSGILTSITTMFIVDIYIGSLVLVSILFLTFFNVFMRLQVIKIFTPRLIKDEDKFSQNFIEGLNQVIFIRSIFATDEQLKKQRKRYDKVIVSRFNTWQNNHFFDVLLLTLVNLITVLIIVYLSKEIYEGRLSLEFGSIIITSFTISTSRIIVLGSRIKRVFESIEHLNNLFEFIRNYGQQSFPV